ncbi:MAG TPA: sulfatase [Sumerlaeia bacterium]|nr:sulfatase [Sumerlaeia bacterium]
MTARPNILYIMSDDHAANAISCYGSRLAAAAPTPNLDRIAREGMRLDNCFCTNAICTPSRATIMTGQYSHVNGVYTLADALDRERPNAAKTLQAAGYQTAVIGKWHLKTRPSGFDYYNVLPGQGLYHDPLFKEKGKPWADSHEGGEKVEGYVTDLIADFSLDWLKRRDPDRPFFLMCHHKAPHDHWEYDEKHAETHKGVTFPEPESLWEDKSHRSEGSRDYGSTIYTLAAGRMSQDWYPTGKLDIAGMSRDDVKRAAYQKYMHDYLRCVASIDDNVGRLLEYLDEADLAEDTVVIYTSDQGQFLGEHDYYDKRWIFEEALRMPFLVRYPREIEAGTVNKDIILNTDFAPTFLDYAGQATPSDMQGRSFRPALTGNRPPDWRASMYYRYWMHMAHHSNPAHYGVRTQRYKLIFFYGLPLDASGAEPEPTAPGMELYDLEKDPKELHNVYDDPAYADAVRELKEELLRLKAELGDADEQYPDLMRVRERSFR